ncbi:unnamed protein product [Candida verbasci]|uniref:Mtf2-like C-terminal domain-containing protein n=1 Tax=Candida verbasci TaxID=1227364 RepID=A0A9W4XKI7_9ASCO|nr:unnamed protein product [Candida verbasci]
MSSKIQCIRNISRIRNINRIKIQRYLHVNSILNQQIKKGARLKNLFKKFEKEPKFFDFETKVKNQQDEIMKIDQNPIDTEESKTERFSEIDGFHKLSQFIQEAYPKKQKEDNNFIDSILNTENSKSAIKSLDIDIKNKLDEKCKEALNPTIEFLDSIPNSLELYKCLSSFFNQTSKLLEDHKSFNIIYLPELSNKEWSSVHDDLIERIATQSTEYPKEPLINVLTIPIILNFSLKKIGFRFYNGPLAMSIFNQLKSNVPLYFISCNQQTYNEILRIVWIYYGIIDLYQFEKKFTEMKIMGYEGDVTTFHILKVVIDEYNGLRHGKSDFNKYGTEIQPIENIDRERFLRHEFINLKHRLNKGDEEEEDTAAEAKALLKALSL